jgi:hypothetical protein
MDLKLFLLVLLGEKRIHFDFGDPKVKIDSKGRMTKILSKKCQVFPWTKKVKIDSKGRMTKFYPKNVKSSREPKSET